jgi:predicted DCC family thiol-disulfide oxidoreductase YuxK
VWQPPHRAAPQPSVQMLAVGVAIFATAAVAFLAVCLRRGHVQACTDLVISLVLLALGSAGLVFEVLRWVLFPLNWVQRRWLRRARADVRRLVIFDGICVLCNKFGRFSFYRLVNPDLVSFVPFQDSQHIKIDELQLEFKFGEADVKSRIAFVSGDRIFWGADAIIELCRWFDWPFPLARFAYLVPRPIRDVLYQIVADNRYRWFGTQALDKNFARQLCPYYYFKGKKGDGEEKTPDKGKSTGQDSAAAAAETAVSSSDEDNMEAEDKAFVEQERLEAELAAAKRKLEKTQSELRRRKTAT